MSSIYDLHSHSTASDGALSPSELVQKASEAGVKVLALTDHDTLAGLAEARRAARQCGLTLIDGVELSVTWQDQCFHIVGLNVNAHHEPLRQGIEHLQTIRVERAREMARCLAKRNIPGAYEAVVKMAGGGMITRTHFARYLVGQGYAKDVRSVFERFLVKGKPGYVPTQWAELEAAIGWIESAGGVAVLAHPLRYKLTGNKMRRLLAAFREAGGRGIEIVWGNSSAQDIQTCAAYARQFELAGSVGSDFHSPENSWLRLGRLAPLPSAIKPVWALWPDEGRGRLCSA